MGWLSSILSLLGNLFGGLREHAARKNAPEIKANKVARDDAALAEHIAALEARMATGDKAAMEEYRKLTAE